jgi:hypothetical protein
LFWWDTATIGAVLSLALLAFASGQRGWRFKATLYWLRTLYGLLSLPFVLFKLPLMGSLLTPSRATGYDPAGFVVLRINPAQQHQQLAQLVDVPPSSMPPSPMPVRPKDIRAPQNSLAQHPTNYETDIVNASTTLSTRASSDSVANTSNGSIAISSRAPSESTNSVASVPESVKEAAAAAPPPSPPFKALFAISSSSPSPGAATANKDATSDDALSAAASVGVDEAQRRKRVTSVEGDAGLASSGSVGRESETKPPGNLLRRRGMPPISRLLLA